MVKLFCDIFLNFILRLFDYIPAASFSDSIQTHISNFLTALGYFNSLLGLDIFVTCLSHALFFWSLDVIWGVVEWVYKKIPGVD